MKRNNSRTLLRLGGNSSRQLYLVDVTLGCSPLLSISDAFQRSFPNRLCAFVRAEAGAPQLNPADKNIIAVSAGRKPIWTLPRLQICMKHMQFHAQVEDFSGASGVGSSFSSRPESSAQKLTHKNTKGFESELVSLFFHVSSCQERAPPFLNLVVNPGVKGSSWKETGLPEAKLLQLKWHLLSVGRWNAVVRWERRVVGLRFSSWGCLTPFLKLRIVLLIPSSSRSPVFSVTSAWLLRHIVALATGRTSQPAKSDVKKRDEQEGRGGKKQRM